MARRYKRDKNGRFTGSGGSSRRSNAATLFKRRAVGMGVAAGIAATVAGAPVLGGSILGGSLVAGAALKRQVLAQANRNSIEAAQGH